MSILSVVVGGAFGSEAKGSCAARLAKEWHHNGIQSATVIRVAGPNAGHTAYDDNGKAWALRQIPVAAVTSPSCRLVIGPGSEIDFGVLADEILSREAAGVEIRNRLWVDEQATIITEEHKQTEADRDMHRSIGSTAKGIGAARADRIMRTAPIVKDYASEFRSSGIQVLRGTGQILMSELRDNPEAAVCIEGTQGYGLGLHAGHYPKCTSSDTRAIDFCSLAGIDPVYADDYEVWVVLRTYPIRVAGNSGELKGETSWEALGFAPEHTTVTKKVRRVGTWDPELAAASVFENGGSRVVKVSLSMADYVVPDCKDFEGDRAGLLSERGQQVTEELDMLIEKVESDCGAPVYMAGTGPNAFYYPKGAIL